ncbi:hypothetical protein J2Z21_005733 [Streptomyces griseochromogenes]|uniref:Uncharacterized protein n=2 Tax=Streptomyces griseochromogenes TaxID=68214 RepID=A0ABS4LZA9_9ACTN|nr:hypothetical protein [Streptomyces griseochromogenes]MBP2052746.1 hypothetical protein [Streptomyces griseochromogenes]
MAITLSVMGMIRRLLGVTGEDIERLRQRRLAEQADGVTAFLAPGETLVGTAQARLVATPVPPDRLIPRLPPIAPTPAERDGESRLARAAGWAYLAMNPFQTAGEVLADSLSDALWYVPDKITDYMAVDRRADWSTMAARLVLLTLAIRQLDAYSGDFVMAATDHRVLVLGYAYGDRAPLYPLVQYSPGEIASVLTVPTARSAKGKEEPHVALTFRDGSSVTAAPDAISGTRFAELLRAVG